MVNSSVKLIITIVVSIVIAIIIILLGYLIKNKSITDTESKYTHKTKFVFAKDGKSYKVHNFEDADEAANTLADINATIIKLISHLKYKYIGGGYDQKISDNNISGAIHKMLMRYNPDNIVENSPKDKQDTSFTLNKGSTIALCLREKDKNTNLHDTHTLLFVAIHELAHIAIDDNEHPPEFWQMFKFLLAEAEIAGIYKSKDYKNSPVHYCGMAVDYNPIYDQSVALTA
jgi:hypothetical protein